MHEGGCGLKEDLDDSAKVCHAAQVQADAAACQPNGVMQQEGGVRCLLIQCPRRLIDGVIDYVAKAGRAPNKVAVCTPTSQHSQGPFMLSWQGVTSPLRNKHDLSQNQGGALQ